MSMTSGLGRVGAASPLASGLAPLGAGHAETIRFATLSRTSDKAAALAELRLAQMRTLQQRIHNDLQGVCSLAAFHGHRADGIASEAGFEAVCRRSMALAALYEELLRSEGATNVNFASYLAMLCKRLAAAGGSAGASLTLHVEDGAAGSATLLMPSHRASTLGMVVADLVAAVSGNAAHCPDFRVAVQLMPAHVDGRERLFVGASGTLEGADEQRSREGCDITSARGLVAEAGGELDRFVSRTDAGWCIRF